MHGEVQEGEFHEGVLQGRGKVVSALGEHVEGTWSEGVLNGKGTYRNQVGYAVAQPKERIVTCMSARSNICPYQSGEQFTGYFRDGQRYGRGKYVLDECAMYRGYYQDGAICGHGELLYEPRQSVKPSGDDSVESDDKEGGFEHRPPHLRYDKRISGYWPGNELGQRGLLESLANDVGYFLNRHHQEKLIDAKVGQRHRLADMWSPKLFVNGWSTCSAGHHSS